MYYYIVDLDLDGLVDVGSTTRIEELDQRRPATPIAHVVQYFHRSTKRAEQSVGDYQKMYDDGLQIALKSFRRIAVAGEVPGLRRGAEDAGLR